VSPPHGEYNGRFPVSSFVEIVGFIEFQIYTAKLGSSPSDIKIIVEVGFY
jgi:hypothetical protein